MVQLFKLLHKKKYCKSKFTSFVRLQLSQVTCDRWAHKSTS